MKLIKKENLDVRKKMSLITALTLIRELKEEKMFFE